MPELVPSDLIHAAQLGLIRPDEFGDKAVKFAGNSGKTKPPEILAVTMC